MKMFKLIVKMIKLFYFKVFILLPMRRKIIVWARSKPFIKKVYLYGSFVKGARKKDSDLDIAIEHEKFLKDDDEFTTYFFEKSKWKEDLEKNLHFPRVHLEWAKSEHVGRYITQESTLIYEKDSKGTLQAL